MLTALFVTMLVEQWLSSKKRLPILIGGAVTVVCLVLFGKENFMIPAMCVLLLILCLHKEEEVSHG